MPPKTRREVRAAVAQAKAEGKPVAPEFQEEIQIDVKELVPFAGTCCALVSCFADWPECLGCDVEAALCCIEIETVCCKTSKNPNTCCVCNENSCRCVYPSTIAKGMAQVFCLDARFALPCDKDVPNVVGCCFFTCCLDCGLQCKFMEKIGTMSGAINNK